MKNIRDHIMHFKGGEKYEVITPIFDIEPHTTYVEFPLPDGRYVYYEFNNNHSIREKIIWKLPKMFNISPAEKGIPGESIQGTYQALKN